MKNKILIGQWQFWIAILVIFSIIILIVINIDEPDFRITKNGVEIEDWFFICNNSDYLNLPPTDCGLKEHEYPFKTFFGKYDEGNNVITKENINLEWLDENCECGEQICSFHFNYSKRVKITPENAEKFISITHEGPIWFFTDEDGHNIAEFYEKDAEFVEDCIPCTKYQCEEYIVEVRIK